MREKRWASRLRIALLFLGLSVAPFTTWAEDVPRMTKEELKPLLGNQEVIIVDVRSGSDWNGSKEKIQGAVREDPSKQTKSWADKYSPEKTLVLYCA